MVFIANEHIFYHIYPLGLCGAPKQNNFGADNGERLNKLYQWADHLADNNFNAVYLGPVFESSTHGYDTVDYFKADRRLGNLGALKKLVDYFHSKNIKVIFDAVFNHVGRDFWAFRDVLEKGENSQYCNWFQNLRFGQRSPYGDNFSYESWEGHYSLVKLNHNNPDVREHLYSAARMWIKELKADGLRMDAADCISLEFLKELNVYCKKLKPDFWFLGEIIHGDYKKWANEEVFDSVTNYECYKGLYSSHNDRNYFEIAYSFNRQFGSDGIYKNLNLYNFADNHDVNRVSSTLKNPAHLYPLHILMFTMPGSPSVYYGSEFGLSGVKNGDDSSLRPQLELDSLKNNNGHPGLLPVIKKLASIKRAERALQYGDYSQLAVSPEQLVFSRTCEKQQIIVMVNSSDKEVFQELELKGKSAFDLLNGEGFVFDKKMVVKLHPNWGRILLINN